MSKIAEKKALEAYPILFSERNGYDNTFKDRRESYIKGYDQAMQSFRAEAAKDILTGIVSHSGVSISSTDAHRLTELALTYADELVKQLKEKE